MEPFQYGEINATSILTLSAWTEVFPCVTAGMSARGNYSLHREHDNPAEVVPQRMRLVDVLGFSLEAWTNGVQVHGTRIERVTKDKRGAGSRTHNTAIMDTDGLITDEDDVLLTAFYADCVPLLFWDPDHSAIGIAHAGWRGTVGGIASKMLKQMQQTFSTKPDTVRVAIGPSIGSCCYEVDDVVIEALQEQIPSLPESIVQPNENGRYMLDLKQANADILKETGVREQHLLVTNYCTCCEQQLFFSHRRDGEKAGRMVAWIGKRKDES